MKKKLTLSVDQRKILLLRKAGARRSKTISALLEETADRIEAEDEAKDYRWLKEMGTWLAGKYTEKDLKADPRFAHAMGYKQKTRRKG